MTIEEQLKNEILRKYKSVRAFTNTINIPYSTLDSVFKRGIANSGVSTMIKVFNALDLDIESTQSGELRHRISEYKNSPSATGSAPGMDTYDIYAEIKQQFGTDAHDALLLYVQLDEGDRGEIRGEMKHMLKADKYNSSSCSKGEGAMAV